MSVKTMLFEVIEEARKAAEEEENGHLHRAVDNAEVFAMIEMWDKDRDLETLITDSVLELFLEQANSQIQ